MSGTPAAEPAVIDALQRLLASYKAAHTNNHRNTAAGHWINEAFVVRLYAVLDAHNVVGGNKRIDKSLEGWKMVDATRRLRHEIAHSTGNVADPDAHELDRRLRELFDLGDIESIFDGKFLLPKDRVLRPMHGGCVRYCQLLLDKENATNAV